MKKTYIILITAALIALTVFVHQRNENNENAEMERFAKIIADETDEDFENVTINLLDSIKNDKLFNFWLRNNDLPSDDSILSHFNTQYFYNFDVFKNYKRTLTVCDSSTYINFYDMGFECIAYFDSHFKNNKITSISKDLYHVDDPTSDIYYIAKIILDKSQILYIEFYKEKIYNKFLINSDSTNINNYITPNLKNYSFGIYNNNILNYKLGNYYYPNNFKNFISQEDGIHKGKKFKHLIINDLENNKSIVVTIDSLRWMRFIAPFSFIFFALLLAYFLYIYFENGRNGFFRKSFHGKMQVTILLVLAFSFFVIGFTSFLFLRNNITKKTQIEQYKQANIIRNNLETRMLSNNIGDVFLIFDLKETFLCDINIYDINGILTNSTVEGTNLFADSINEKAYKTIFDEKAGYFVQTEFYKDERNTSYYFPILNEKNKLAAILNVLYFDSNSEYDDQLSDFVLNYINIIIVLFGISSIIVVLITRKTLKPLKIIEEQMGKISFGGNNEPIEWNSRDEIGALIQQYNKMRWQLENSANKIARNERENAWREMARQVAHEIKNPLTPMRLNIEYLQMLWDRKDPNFEKNLKETLGSLLEQIETLSKIATAFSNYAKLSGNEPTTFELNELVKSTIKLYDVEKNISISLVYNENEDWSLYTDKNNLGRVVGNIIKNAIQAIGNTENGRIEVIISKLGERYKIRISDNGCGIREEDKKKIFFPNFTTKSSGMGVGLSVSQDIMQAMGGNITFESKEGIGTVFTIDIPILKEK